MTIYCVTLEPITNRLKKLSLISDLGKLIGHCLEPSDWKNSGDVIRRKLPSSSIESKLTKCFWPLTLLQN